MLFGNDMWDEALHSAGVQGTDRPGFEPQSHHMFIVRFGGYSFPL